MVLGGVLWGSEGQDEDIPSGQTHVQQLEVGLGRAKRAPDKDLPEGGLRGRLKVGDLKGGVKGAWRGGFRGAWIAVVEGVGVGVGVGVEGAGVGVE